jgi:TonB family protein
LHTRKAFLLTFAYSKYAFYMKTFIQLLTFQLCLIFTPLSIWQCQQPPATKAEPVIVDKDAQFKGGIKALFEFIKANLHNPEFNREKGIEGTVYVSFTIEADGQVTNIKIERGIGEGFHEEAIRVVKSTSGMWEPRIYKGIKVSTPYTIPIKFTFE